MKQVVLKNGVSVLKNVRVSCVQNTIENMILVSNLENMILMINRACRNHRTLFLFFFAFQLARFKSVFKATFTLNTNFYFNL